MNPGQLTRHIHDWVDNWDWNGGPSSYPIRQCTSCDEDPDETTRRAIRADLADRVTRRLQATETLLQSPATTLVLGETIAAIWEEAAK